MTKPDIVEWLSAELDHDEAHAKKDLWALDRATQGRWVAHYGYNLPYSLLKVDGVETVRLTATRGALPDGEEDIHAADALLVARLVNKARARAEAVLRTVAAHRAILKLHDRLHECSTLRDGEVDNCTWVMDPAECSTLLAIAAIYSDRPGFDPSWRLS